MKTNLFGAVISDTSVTFGFHNNTLAGHARRFTSTFTEPETSPGDMFEEPANLSAYAQCTLLTVKLSELTSSLRNNLGTKSVG